ncbi:uncharacterized protein LOC118508100 [Anopheles stephensi]|uniref:uncharacterized protein LOC118508100 n=1 Tax=Anopheles stephensi TaxID=30069 RepID=UPI00165898CA|nr:uncharacterized protein LOC118508100 [Anopheles stephensi]
MPGKSLKFSRRVIARQNKKPAALEMGYDQQLLLEREALQMSRTAYQTYDQSSQQDDDVQCVEYSSPPINPSNISFDINDLDVIIQDMENQEPIEMTSENSKQKNGKFTLHSLRERFPQLTIKSVPSSLPNTTLADGKYNTNSGFNNAE